MVKGLLGKIKTGLFALGLTSGLSFGITNAQTTDDHATNYETKNFKDTLSQKIDTVYLKMASSFYLEDTIYQEKGDKYLESILNDFLGEYLIQTRTLENLFGGGKVIYASKIPAKYLRKSYDDNGLPTEDSDDKRRIWEYKEMAKWLQSLGEFKRDSLKKSILEKGKKIEWDDLEYARQELDSNYPPNESVNIPGTDLYIFNSAWLFKKNTQEDTLIMERYEDKIIWKNKNKKIITPISK